jgi:hypothetical protein
VQLELDADMFVCLFVSQHLCRISHALMVIHG